MRSRFLAAAFPVQQGERALTLLLFFQNACAVGAFVAGRSVRDALFLAEGPASSLAWMYVASAAGVALTGLLYAPLAARLPRDRMAAVSALLFSLLYVLSALWERHGGRGLYSALYVYVEVMGALSLLQFWTFANELFHAREAKRLYGLIGAGGTVANIVVGLATGVLALRFGARVLLWLSALLCVGTAVSAFYAGQWGRQRLFARAAGRREKARAGVTRQVFSKGPLALIALLAAVTFFTTTLVDFEFKVVAAGRMSRDSLASYFGYLYAVTGGLAIGLQLFGVSRILQRAGIVGGLAVLPGSLALGNLGLALSQSLWAATWVKASDGLFRYTVNDATTQLLYLPFSAHTRVAAKAFIDAVVKPLAIALCGASLLFYRWEPGSSVRPLAWLALVLCGGWLFLVLAVRSRYVQSLQEGLRKRRWDLGAVKAGVEDGSSQRLLRRALEQGAPREQLHALEFLPQLGNVDLDHQVEALLTHPLPDIRVATLAYYARRESLRFANSIFRAFDDPHPKVRAAAIEAFCAVGKDKAVRSVKSFLTDEDPGVRAAALTGLIRYGGLDGLLLGAEALKSLLAHPQAAMRRQAAQVLGDIGIASFHPSVGALLKDAAPEVRRAAIRAVAQLKSLPLVPPLLESLKEASTRREAVEALADFGADILPLLGTTLGNRLETETLRMGAARLIGRVKGPHAVELLTQVLLEPNVELRTALYRSLVKSLAGQSLSTRQRGAVDAALALEMVSATQTLEACRSLQLHPLNASPLAREKGEAARALLASALYDKLHQTDLRLFLLLAALYPEAGLDQVHADLRHGRGQETARRRASAVELLDNLLDRSLKDRLLPLLERISRLDAGQALQDAAPPSQSAEATLQALYLDESAWVRACALHFASVVQDGGLPWTLLANASQEAHPLIREMALVACTRLYPARTAELATPCLQDEASAVRRWALQLIRVREGAPMLSTIEKVLFLKSIELFSQTRGEALAEIGLIALEELHETGDEIFAEGDSGDALYLVLEGKVRVHRQGQTLAELGERECFGEMALLDSETRSANVTTMGPTGLLRISREDFQELLVEKPEIALGIIKVLTARLRRAAP